MAQNQKHTLESVLQRISERLTEHVRNHEARELSFKVVTTRDGTIRDFEIFTRESHREVLQGLDVD
jgi:predicted Fe-Mo cluster-binding NifX family protein